MNRRQLLQTVSLNVVCRVHDNPLPETKVHSAIVEAFKETYLRTMEALEFDASSKVALRVMHREMSATVKQLKDIRSISHANVVCDASNNPPSVVESGIVAVDVSWSYSSGMNETHLYIGPWSRLDRTFRHVVL